MRILFAGTPEPAVPSLTALAESGHEVVAVLTRPDAPKGRGRTASPSAVAIAARERGLPVLTPTGLRDVATQRELRALGAEAAAVVAYGALIPPALLADMPWVNLHFSLLPRWRGAAPVQRAILAGDPITGASAFLLEEGLDTGPVIASLTRPIGPAETAGQVLDALARAGAQLLVEAFDALAAGTARPVPQPADGVTLAPRLSTAEARIDWSATAAQVDRHVRAFAPAPGAWSTLAGGQRIKVGPVTPAAGSLAPGEIAAADGAVMVGTGTVPVRLGQVAPAGRSWMDAASWMRGVRGTAQFEDQP